MADSNPQIIGLYTLSKYGTVIGFTNRYKPMKTQPMTQFKAKFKGTKIIKRFISWQRKNFGFYAVTDSYGTFQVTLTEQQALAWLPHCSPNAKVI